LEELKEQAKALSTKVAELEHQLQETRAENEHLKKTLARLKEAGNTPQPQ